jgi:hypothetical protein
LPNRNTAPRDFDKDEDKLAAGDNHYLWVARIFDAKVNGSVDTGTTVVGRYHTQGNGFSREVMFELIDYIGPIEPEDFIETHGDIGLTYLV